MGRIIVINNVTLDGVMQAPGRPDEDTRDGFRHGGWAAAGNADPDVGRVMGERMACAGPLLLGRRTYEDFAGYWPRQTDNPFTAVLDAVPKYVASTTLREPLPWNNSTLLKGDVPAAVADLKRRERDMAVLGSGELFRTLLRHRLVDELVLLVHPLVLGGGRRLFADGAPPAGLRLMDSVTAASGVVVATYQFEEARP